MKFWHILKAVRMKPLFKKCMLRLGLFMLYGALGGWIFTSVERRSEPYAITANRSLSKLKATMKEKYNFTNITDSDFSDFVAAAYKAIHSQKQRDWTFDNGASFAFVVLTTIGYGDITPKTSLGQGLTIPYCLIGLPLTMLALKTSGEVILLGLRAATICLEKKLLGHQHPEMDFIKLFVIIIFCQASLICIFAVVQMYADGWTFLEGAYCWFITFTTIGFGDYVPFNEYEAKSKSNKELLEFVGVFVIVPYIIGLCLLASLLNLVVEKSDEIKRRLGILCRSCCDCQNSVNTHDGSSFNRPNVKGQENNIHLESFTNTNA